LAPESEGDRLAAGRARVDHAVRDWNVVVTVLPEGFRDAVRILSAFAPVASTDYYGVLVMRVEDGRAFLEALRDLLQTDASLANAVARVVPVTDTFSYGSTDEFRSKTEAVVESWVGALAGKRFYVRMHRRGFKGRLSSSAEERRLGAFLLSRIPSETMGTRVDFTHPEVMIAVETVGNEAGLALYTRADLDRYELLRLA